MMSDLVTGTITTAMLDALRTDPAVIVQGPNTNDSFMTSDGGVRFLIPAVTDALAREGYATVVHSPAGTVQRAVDGVPLPALRLPPADATSGEALRDLAAALAACDQPVGLVVDHADQLLPDGGPASTATPDEQLLFQKLSGFPSTPELSGHRLLLIDRYGGLDPRFARTPGFAVVSAELPTLEERRHFASRLTRPGRKATFASLEPNFTADELAAIYGGLPNEAIRRLSMRCASEGRAICRSDIQRLKIDVLGRAGTHDLIVHPPGNGLASVAGLPQLRLFVREREHARSWPRALVLPGPPGVGKTLVVSAVADELGWPAVSLGNFRSPWVGETDRNLFRVLSTVRAMAPVVVHIDEADQALGTRGTGPSSDGGTSERILAALWEFLGSCPPDNQVLFVLTTNRPDLLDEATRSRAEVIPVLHPTGTEQVELLGIAARARGLELDDGQVRRLLSEHFGGAVVSGRMIVKAVDRAAVLAHAEPGTPGHLHLKAALVDLLERADPLQDERMALKALQQASFVFYLPWVASERLGEPVEHLPYVVPLLVGGRLDRERLDARVAHLDERYLNRRRGLA
jgi:hypothetical protein